MTTPMGTPEPGANAHPQLSALGREVERLSRRHADLDALVRQLAEDITALAPADNSDGDDQPEGLASWLAADDPGQARALLADLASWLGRVYLRYPGAALPSCWAWHPAVVEELWWLRNAHHDAYHGRSACWREVGDWHDRMRPGVAARIRKAIGDCELSRHTPGGDRCQPTPGAPLRSAADRVAEHWTTHHATPEPTEQQLHEADQHDQAQLRNHP
ncbi:MAG: hypothetical protein GEV09_15915 [Pseudonocardiaceae bacterium]|nr:hypothetical protein [Pseudonocardiaceae bacterium]